MFRGGFLAAVVAVAVVSIVIGSASAASRTERGPLVMEGIPEISPAVSEGLRQYQNTRTASFAGWSNEGILIATRFGEAVQVHHVKSPGAARRQMTFFDEPVGDVWSRVGDDAFIFAKDSGGDEYHQLYRQDLKTGATMRFTEAGTRNDALAWSEDGTKFAWSRVSKGDGDWDILTADAAAPEASRRVALEGKGAIFPVAWSADKQRLLIAEYVSVAKTRLFTLDLAGGTPREIRADLDAAWEPIGFSADGTKVYASTDHESEFLRLVSVDLATGEIRPLTEESKWDVESTDLSPDGRLLVYTLNAGGRSEIQILDLKTGKTRGGPKLPPGIVSGLEFDAKGRNIGFTFESHASPDDAWSFDVKTLKLTRWTESETGGLDSASFVEPELIAFANADGMQIPAWIYRPKTPGPHPVLINIHGGPEAQSRPSFTTTVQFWVRDLGIAVIVPNVRGSSGYGKTFLSLDNGRNRKKSVEDIGALLDWVGTQNDLDKDRVVVFGGSYGGYMVLASLVDYGDRLAGGVNIVGISNFVTFLENTEGYRRDLRRVEYGDERDPEMRKFLESISPLNHADKIRKPLFIIQGLNDPRVPASEAEQILKAVKKNGGKAWFLMAKNEGHGFQKKSNRDFMNEAVAMFLIDVLDLPRED